MIGQQRAGRAQFRGLRRMPGRRRCLLPAMGKGLIVHLQVLLACFLLPVAFLAPSASSQETVSATGGTVPCSGPQTRQLVWDFFTAFNRGDLAGLDELFAPAPAFRWYSSAAPGRRLGPAARRRGNLIPYFSARNAKHDVFNDQRVHLSASAPHWSNFWFEARRAADGFRGGKHFAVVGKGSAICRSEHAQLIVVTVGRPHP